MPSVHSRCICDQCGKEMRADKLRAHERSHEILKLRLAVRAEKQVRVTGLKNQLKKIIGQEKLDQMYHMYYRVNCFTPETTVEKIESHFNIAADLVCSCGATRDTAHPHTHLLGTWQGPNECHKNRSLAQYFSAERAYSCKNIGSYQTLYDKIACIKHFIHTACYIQTKRGWHKKTEQRNPYTFANIEEKNNFLSELYREWMWAQVSYMRYLQQKMDDIAEAIEFCQAEETLVKLKEKLSRVDGHMMELEEIWGEEHHYSDQEIQDDLDLFLETCKEIGNS